MCALPYYECICGHTAWVIEGKKETNCLECGKPVTIISPKKEEKNESTEVVEVIEYTKYGYKKTLRSTLTERP